MSYTYVKRVEVRAAGRVNPGRFGWENGIADTTEETLIPKHYEHRAKASSRSTTEAKGGGKSFARKALRRIL